MGRGCSWSAPAGESHSVWETAVDRQRSIGIGRDEQGAGEGRTDHWARGGKGYMRHCWGRRGGCSVGDKDWWRGTGRGRGSGERERGRRGGGGGIGIERVLVIVIVFVIVGFDVGVGCNLEKRFFLATWETTERSERARTFFAGERWRRGTGWTVVGRCRGRRRRRRRGRRCRHRHRRVVWGLW